MTDQAVREDPRVITPELFKAPQGSVCAPVTDVIGFDGERAL